MSTRAQRRANLRNAELSTGPRTPEGKAASSRNAIRHNLSGSTFVLLPGEDRAAFDALLRDYRGEWQPRTPHELFLVNQMVQARWRLDRIARMEAEVYDAIFHQFGEGQSDEGAILIADRVQGSDNTLRKLHRYAQDAERSYHRAVREAQQYRKTKPAPDAAEIAEIQRSIVPKQPVQNEPNPLDRDAIMAIFEQRIGDLSALPPETRAELEDLAAAGVY